MNVWHRENDIGRCDRFPICRREVLPAGVCPEEWILENPDVLKELQIEYYAAGSDAVYAPTFSGNRIKLEEYGLQDNLVEMNHGLVAISKQAVAEVKERGLVDADKPLYVCGRSDYDG